MLGISYVLAWNLQSFPPTFRRASIIDAAAPNGQKSSFLVLRRIDEAWNDAAYKAG